MRKNFRTITLPSNIRFSPENLCSLLKEHGFVFKTSVVSPYILKEPKNVWINPNDSSVTFEQWEVSRAEPVEAKKEPDAP